MENKLYRGSIALKSLNNFPGNRIRDRMGKKKSLDRVFHQRSEEWVLVMKDF